MNKRMNKNMSVVLSTLMVASSFAYYAPVARASEVEDLQLSLTPKKKIDVALSVGNTEMSVTNFERDLTNKLADRGVDRADVNIQSLETSSMSTNDADASTIFNSWKKYPLLNDSKFNAGWMLSGDVIYTTANVHWTGFWDDKNQDATNQTIDFEVNTTAHQDPWGYTFRMTSPSHDRYSFYALEWGPYHRELTLAKITSWQPSYSDPTHGGPLYHGTINSADGHYNNHGGGDRKSNALSHANGDVLVAVPFNVQYGRWDKTRIEANGNRIKVWVNNNLVIDYTDNNNPLLKGASGPYTASQYNTSFKNVAITTESTKSFKEIISEPKWREDSERFIVNVEDVKITDFDDSSALGEILPRLINEEIHYVGLGQEINRSQSSSFISKNNENGIFLNNSNYEDSLNKTADYIVSQLESETGDGEYVLVGEPIDIQVSPASLATNTQTPEYPLGRWRIDHDYDFYENHLGQASWANQWQKDLQMVFDKPGKYDIGFGDKHPNPRYVYAHRRPVASFATIVRNNGGNFGITLQDYSYDLDMESRSDKGIAEKEWKWRNTTDSSWTNGQIPSSLPLGNDYIVQLRVKDHQGVWSAPESRYITTDSVVARPVSNFKLTPNPVTLYENLNVEDISYDPAGRTISEKIWTVTKEGSQVYVGSTPLTNFRSYGEGLYRVSLKVKNNANLWSEEFTRTVTVTSDKEAPEAIVSPTSRSWSQDNVNINVTYTDKGGSGFKHQRYAVTTSATPPTSGWSTYSSSTSRSVTISTEGKNYLHIESEDNVGNKTTRTIGEYQIDRTAPGMNHTLSPASWHNDEVVIQATGTDSDSGVKSIKLPNGNKVFATNTSYAVEENGDYVFEIEDNTGNKSTKAVKVSTIDKINPSATHTVEHVDGDTYKITLKGGDDASGVKRIKLPNGQYQNGETVTFNGLKDQTYTFEVEDIAGNKLTYKVKITAPNLNVYQKDNHVKAEWAIEMLDDDVLNLTGFEDGDEIPSNIGRGGQSLTTEDSFTGSRSFKIEDTVSNGNWYQFPATSGIRSITHFGRKQFKNGTDLSISFKAKSDVGGILMPNGDGGWGETIVTLPNKVTKNVSSGTETIPLDSLTGIYIGSYVTFDTEPNLIRGVYQIRSIDNESKTITLHTGVYRNIEAGEDLKTRPWRGAWSFNQRTIPGNNEWTNFSINTKVYNYGDYNVALRGGSFYIGSQTAGKIYLDDIKFGFATKAQLFRGDTKVYEGLLSDYEDREATDKANPDKVTVANVSAKNGSVFMDIVKPKDNGTSYDYTVRALSNKGDWVESEKKEVTVTSEIVGYSYVIDNQAGTIPDNTIDSRSEKVQIPITSNAQYYIHVKAIDEAGNVSDVTHIPFRDATAPIMELSQNPTSWTAGNVVIQANAIDESLDMKRIKLPNGTWVNGDSASYTVTANGTYTFVAEDLVGNQSTKSITVTNIDKTNPTAPTINNNEEWVKADSMNVTILAGTDGASGVKRVEYKLEGATSQNWTTYTGTFAIRNEGETKVLSRTIDNVGHASDESTSFVRLDRSAPYNMGITIKLKP